MSDTALLVIDAQESFRHRPYYRDDDVPAFVERLQTLVEGAKGGGIPVVQVFHVEDSGPFAPSSGFVETLSPLRISPDAVFMKRSRWRRWPEPQPRASATCPACSTSMPA